MTSPTITIRTRLAGALAAVLVIAAIAIGSSQPAAAAATTVRQGETVTLAVFSDENDPFSVDPLDAGTVSIPAGGGNPTFTASATFQGQATVCVVGTSCFDVIIVVANTAAAQGSFVPVVAPGPCLLITVNPVVDFGNVTLGSDYTTAAAPPQIAGCAPSGVIQDIAIRATDAQNGLTSLNVDDSCPVDPVSPPANPLEVCDPAVGTYSVAVPSTIQSGTQTDRNLLVRSGSSVLLDDQAGSFATTLVDLAVKLPSELAPTFVGSIFTFDVVFTAIPS